MARKHFCVLVNIIDEVMGIGQSEITDNRDFSIARKLYLSDIGFKFTIGIFRYKKVGVKQIGLLSFGSTRGRQTQVLISSKPSMQHHKKHWKTF